MSICVIVGTRPEIIKMCPIIRSLEREGADYFVLHTGQHYSYEMDGVFFDQLKLSKPKYNLASGSGTHAEETARMLVGIEKILLQERPGIVLVEGDTNSVLAGSLAASKLLIKLAHVEAGLRSFDRTMPEEINRVIADHLSGYLFAPTNLARENLLAEGIHPERVFVTGNTIVDAVLDSAKMAGNGNHSHSVGGGEYFLVTLHRQENVDNPDRLKRILKGLDLVSHAFGAPVVYPIHPRAKKRIIELGLIPNNGMKFVEPLDYLSFLRALQGAKIVFTDSGGVQEEACVLRVPCVTLRDNTERPETLEVGSNTLAGTDPATILEKAEFMNSKDREWTNPFGDGHAAQRIVDVVIRLN